MPRGGAALLVMVIGSAYYLLRGTLRLWRHGAYGPLARVVVSLGLCAGTAYILLATGWERPTGDERVWFAAPAIILLLVLLAWGFIVRQYVEKVLGPGRARETVGGGARRMWMRVLGLLLLAIAVAVWLYGVYHPLGGKTFIYGLLVCLGCLISGLRIVAYGTRIDDIE
jgi:hypothetical protein